MVLHVRLDVVIDRSRHRRRTFTSSSTGFDVLIDFGVVLTSVHPAVGYAFGATKGVLQSQDPFGNPGLLVVRASHPSKPRRSRSFVAVFYAEHGPLPLVISSQDTVLVAVVGSVTGANQPRSVRFIERFAEAGDRSGARGAGRVRPR